MYAPVVAAVTLLATGAVAQGLTYDTFDDRCKYLSVLGSGKKGQTAITAACLDDAGKRWQTTLNLNLCIGNDAGKLAWQDNGNFDQTCRPCTIGQLDNGPARNLGLKCNCLPAPNAVPKYTELAVSPNNSDALGVKLVDGRFVCGSHQGDKVERN
ncbi:Cyanovirin-N [Akanthomyces lecanii RCEF 1005]|uniref:Cyanovirin-N n=1 Tax=Akanthomyces lecanii RCEF 1005 TaxID=1081108 RepID=A0A168HB97_CORDF|nr:Cyanovirin-N [Akanthomyces lecanii RCEF 1005]